MPPGGGRRCSGRPSGERRAISKRGSFTRMHWSPVAEGEGGVGEAEEEDEEEEG